MDVATTCKMKKKTHNQINKITPFYLFLAFNFEFNLIPKKIAPILQNLSS